MAIKVGGRYLNEGSNGGKLDFLGKLCRYIEEFYGVELTENDLSGLIDYDNIMKSDSFKNGYERASALIKNGFNLHLYNDWLLGNQKQHPELFILYSKLYTVIKDKNSTEREHSKC